MAAQNLMPQCGSTQNTLHCGITKTSWTVATPTKKHAVPRQNPKARCNVASYKPLHCNSTKTHRALVAEKTKTKKKLMHCGNTHNTLHCNTIICYIVAAQQMRCTGAALDTRGTRNGGPKTMWHHKKQIQTTTTKNPHRSLQKKKQKNNKKYCSTAAAAGQKNTLHCGGTKTMLPCGSTEIKKQEQQKTMPCGSTQKTCCTEAAQSKKPKHAALWLH